MAKEKAAAQDQGEAQEQAAAQDQGEAATYAVRVPFAYGDANPGDIVHVDGDEAERLVEMGAALAPAAAAAEGEA